MTRFFSVPLIVLLCFVLTSEVVLAGFGVTPPFVRNTSLTRNSTYEQQILIIRSDPTEDLKATITLDTPGFSEWIEVNEGREFVLPRGQQKTPMTVRVRVPDDAEFRTYSGALRIRTGPMDDQVAAGAVTISLGAQIDIEVNVIDRIIKDFKIRRVQVGDLNEGTKLGWLFFPGKINFTMLLENTGNIEVAPSKVVMRIYDATGTVLLEETQHKGKLNKVKPFAVEDVYASVPTRLPAGTYKARYEVFNDDEVKQAGEVTLSILPYGTLQAAGFGFSGLSFVHKLSVVMPIVALVVILLLVFISRRRNRSSNE
jgi:hypothetical protein